MVYCFCQHRLQPPFEEACESCGHLHEVRRGVAVAGVKRVEGGFFEGVVDLVFVVFCYMEYEWSEAGVVVLPVLFPSGCASDGDYDACACFSDFYGGCVYGGDCCFLVVGLQGYRLVF